LDLIATLESLAFDLAKGVLLREALHLFFGELAAIIKLADNGLEGLAIPAKANIIGCPADVAAVNTDAHLFRPQIALITIHRKGWLLGVERNFNLLIGVADGFQGLDQAVQVAEPGLDLFIRIPNFSFS